MKKQEQREQGVRRLRGAGRHLPALLLGLALVPAGRALGAAPEPNTSDSYLVSKTVYDAAGRIQETVDNKGIHTVRAYDALGRVTQATENYVTGVPGNDHDRITSYTYNADGQIVTQTAVMPRRILKAVNGTGSMDCTYHDCFNGQSVIEERNGSDTPIKQQVWGLTYVDELVQTSLNASPSDGVTLTCDQSYWACQDANYNVLGIVDSSGVLAERYEYSAYGQRRVFTSAGSNDPGCYAPSSQSQRAYDSNNDLDEPYGLCEFGQDKPHLQSGAYAPSRAGTVHAMRCFTVYRRDEPLRV